MGLSVSVRGRSGCHGEGRTGPLHPATYAEQADGLRGPAIHSQEIDAGGKVAQRHGERVVARLDRQLLCGHALAKDVVDRGRDDLLLGHGHVDPGLIQERVRVVGAQRQRAGQVRRLVRAGGQGENGNAASVGLGGADFHAVTPQGHLRGRDRPGGVVIDDTDLELVLSALIVR